MLPRWSSWKYATVYPGAREGITRLREAGLPPVCLTNKPTAFAVPLLRDKGLLDAFAQVYGGDAFERKKPDPLPLVRACAALGTSPADTLMIRVLARTCHVAFKVVHMLRQPGPILKIGLLQDASYLGLFMGDCHDCSPVGWADHCIHCIGGQGASE